MERKKLIGSSDISSVLGINPFKTPLQLWAEKTGRIEPEDLADNENVEWGTRLEEVVAQKFAEKHNVKLIAYKRRFVHPEYEYMSCELDRIISGTEEIVEIKTMHAWKYKEISADEGIPAHIICQVIYAMGLSKRKKAYIAILIGGNRYIEREIDFDQEFFDKMVSAAKIFWAMVQENQAPMAVGDDNDFIIQIHPTNNDQIQEIEEMNSRVALLQQTKANITELIAQKDEIEAAIKQVVGETAGIQTSEYTVTWKNQSITRVDIEALREAGLYGQFAKTSETRILRVRKTK